MINFTRVHPFLSIFIYTWGETGNKANQQSHHQSYDNCVSAYTTCFLFTLVHWLYLIPIAAGRECFANFGSAEPSPLRSRSYRKHSSKQIQSHAKNAHCQNYVKHINSEQSTPWHACRSRGDHSHMPCSHNCDHGQDLDHQFSIRKQIFRHLQDGTCSSRQKIVLPNGALYCVNKV